MPVDESGFSEVAGSPGIDAKDVVNAVSDRQEPRAAR